MVTQNAMKLEPIQMRQKPLSDLVQCVHVDILSAIKEIAQVNDCVYSVFSEVWKKLVLKEIQKVVQKQFVVVACAKSASHK